MSILSRKIKTEDVIETYSEVLPMSGHRADEFLEAVDQALQEQRLPVSTRRQVASSSLGGVNRRFVVYQPTASPLSRFKILLYAEPIGANLAIGWFLVGDGASFGRVSVQIPLLDSVGLIENSDLRAIVQSFHQHAVLRFARDFTLSESYDPTLLRTHGRGALGI